jgi:hypothetical protein
MNERKLSELQKQYRVFFFEKMRVYSVKSPAELTKEKKSEFFTEIKEGWAKHKLLIIQKKETFESDSQHTAEETRQEHEEKKSQEIEKIVPNEPEREYSIHPTKNRKQQHPTITVHSYDEVRPLHGLTKQIIKSEPNQEQTDDLRILFNPSNHFEQDGQYKYPVVKMPSQNSSLKLPRKGRSNQKGYKENDFYNQLKQNLVDIGIANDVHMVIPNFNMPYEPDIVLFDKRLNIYVDIEIDEPYDGYYRYPTHFVNPEDEIKQDNIRDLFFTESGWIVIRFTEKQIHCQTSECIDHIKNVLNSVYNRDFTNDVNCEKEHQWDYNKCIQWQKIYYREKYLGIGQFQKQHSYKEIEIDAEESESIESVIKRTKKFNFDGWNSSIAFDEESHKYLHPNDETGNAEYISVTTLIERFFPFDLKRYIERKAEEENRTEEDVLDEYLIIRDEAAEKGTYLHSQIESYLKKINFDSESKEFKLFLEFYKNEIKKRNLVFSDAEKMIFSNKHNIAGTIDCLFQKNNKDEYVMIDWKRSKKLIIDGRPRVFGYGYALSELSSLDNSSYNRYCLQQNIYKYLVETEYSMKISSMQLVVLHEIYSTYFVVTVPEMKKEAQIILNSLKVKI